MVQANAAVGALVSLAIDRCRCSLAKNSLPCGQHLSACLPCLQNFARRKVVDTTMDLIRQIS
jgi:hypothetical protein